MKLSAPKQGTFVIGVLLIILAIVAHFVTGIAVLKAYDFWIAIAGGVVLALGCFCKGF